MFTGGIPGQKSGIPARDVPPDVFEASGETAPAKKRAGPPSGCRKPERRPCPKGGVVHVCGRPAANRRPGGRAY